MIKRIFDFSSSLIGLIILSPLFILIGILIVFDSEGGVFYKQERIGLAGKPFNLFKFRSMYVNTDNKGLLTVGMRDNRITKIGYFIRKYKIDELSQLINVLIGDMSLVGPRPEVQKYVAYYNEIEKAVFRVKPGITDFASIIYFNENELLSKSESPENCYKTIILPEKLQLGILYMENHSLLLDIELILITILAIFDKGKALNITKNKIAHILRK